MQSDPSPFVCPLLWHVYMLSGAYQYEDNSDHPNLNFGKRTKIPTKECFLFRRQKDLGMTKQQ